MNVFIGVIPLVVSACIVTPHPDRPKEFNLLVPGRKYELRALSEQERASWIVSLCQILGQKIDPSLLLEVAQARKMEDVRAILCEGRVNHSLGLLDNRYL